MHRVYLAQALRAAVSGVRSRWGMPSISKPTMNLRTVAERSSGRVIMGVQVLPGVRFAVEGRLVKTHRIGETDLEQIVVARGHLLEDIRERADLGGVEIRQGGQVGIGQQQHLETARLPRKAPAR